MVSFPPIGVGGGRYIPAGQDLANHRLTRFISGGNNTEGSWAELVDSVPINASGIWVTVGWRGATYNIPYAIDIGIGASGSEIVLIDNLSFMSARSEGFEVFFPIAIPKGTRVSARVRSLSDEEVDIGITFLAATFTSMGSLAGMDNYGDLEGSGTAAQVVIAGDGTKGSYEEIISSAPRNYKYMILTVAGEAANANGYWLIDVAVGASGSEVIVAGDIAVNRTSIIDTPFPKFIHIPITIPKGSRVAVRAAIQDASVSGEDLNVTIMGVY